MATPVADAVALTGGSIDGLVQGGRWEFSGPRVLTYSFSLETELDIAWSSALKAAVRLALAQWSAVADIAFEEIAPNSDVDFSPADIAFAPTGTFLTQVFGAVGLAFFPDEQAADVLLQSVGNTRAEYPNPEGDVYLDSGSAILRELARGGSGFEVILHEIGHGLGLKHPHDDGLNGRPVKFLDERHTVMDGGSIDGSTLPGRYAATPLLLDVAAIQHIYGANMSHRAGDDVYRISPSGGQRVIWDAGGIDTLDLSLATHQVFVFLDEGSLIDPGGNHWVGIAYGVTIENAIGSRFDDVLAGNAAVNRLEGGRGNDTYHPQADDIIVEHPNGGVDWLQPSVPFAVIPDHVENFNYHPDAGAAGVVGNDLDNFVGGNGFANRLEGGAGDDTLSGGVHSGDTGDTLLGGPGDDVYSTIFAVPTIVEFRGEGIDTWRASFSAALPDHVENLVLAGAGNASGTGNALANLIRGGAGNDTLDGRGGPDTLEGGGGNDTYYLGAGDVVIDTGGRDSAFSEIAILGTHPFENVALLPLAGNGWIMASAAGNHLVGNSGANLIDGGAGDDTLEGGRGDDTLIGGAGNDRLDGGRGADRMEGGAGNDTYVVSANRDEVIELARGGIDTVEVDAARYELPAHVENAMLAREGGSIVSGNALANRFIFERMDGIDRILGFESGRDRIVLEDAVFTLGVEALSYDELTGALYYDAVQFAWLGERGDPSVLAPGDYGLA